MLLDAAWLDNHRYLRIVATRADSPRRGVTVTVADFRSREVHSWDPTYEGAIPAESSLIAEAARLEIDGSR